MFDSSHLMFKTPFCMMISGPSGSGKTFFVRELLKNHELLTQMSKDICKVLWFMDSGKGSIKIENCDVEYHEGLASESSVLEYKPNLIVIDDLMNELADDVRMGNLFTKGSHHLNINVVFLTQNLFQNRNK